MPPPPLPLTQVGRTRASLRAAQAAAPRHDSGDYDAPRQLNRRAGSDIVPHVVGALVSGVLVVLGLRFLGNALGVALNNAAEKLGGELRGGLNDAADKLGDKLVDAADKMGDKLAVALTDAADKMGDKLGGSVERAGSELAKATKGFRYAPYVWILPCARALSAAIRRNPCRCVLAQF